MATELSQVYEPARTERAIYSLWLDRHGFDAEPDPGADSYCIVIPPPNVTAALHLGHALNNTIQDTLIRHHRMRGLATLWQPGTDHAGIATQTVVEKRILEEENKRRTDFTREAFVERVEAWKDEYEAKILDQLRRMGASCDWRRTRFTMDEVCVGAVREMFHRLFSDGLIYRGKRLVNWDPATQTVLADDEVEHQDVDGHFWYLRYPLTRPVSIDGGTVEHVTVATTRPETMLGDTAVAMNPADPRAAALVGQTVELPLVGRRIPIVADTHVVMADPESEDEKARYSTGFLKVTPAHDPDDWQIGLRHDLDVINVMAPDGSISDRHGWQDAAGTEAERLIGQDRFEARRSIVTWFKENDLLDSVRDYTHPVGHSYRSHVPIEPYLSDQWYVAVKQPIAGRAESGNVPGTELPGSSLAGLALAPLLEKRLRVVPERYETTYRRWLEDLRDWPISRQLWWGHRIPIWSRNLPVPPDLPRALPWEGEPHPAVVAAVDEASGASLAEGLGATGVRHVLRARVSEEGDQLETYLNLDAPNEAAEAWLAERGWTQDEDVLDTWFSSALWPFSTLGWPRDTPDLRTYYPGSVLTTAREIITLWVTRMVMFGQYALGDIPFADVFIHAMIQDGDGKKMSKSLGNGIDPNTIVDHHGADAMRFTLISMTTQTQDVRMPVEAMTLPDGTEVNSSPKFTVGRNFMNKLWNASRFVLMNLEDTPGWAEVDPRSHLADRWLLHRMQETIAGVSESLAAYRFNDVAERIYRFTWDDFCDWYLEIAKTRIAAGESAPKAILAHALDTILRLLHPVAPFITEALWQHVNEVVPSRGPQGAGEPLLLRAAWPSADPTFLDADAQERFSGLQAIIREVRNVRSHHNVPPSRKIEAIIEAQGEDLETVVANLDLVRTLARLGEVTTTSQAPERQPGSGSAAVGGVTVHLLGVVDVAAERDRLGKQRDKLAQAVAGVEKKLGNESFVSRAPESVVNQERERLARLREELGSLEALLTDLG